MVQAIARATLLHLQIHPVLWPFTFDYSVHIYNHLPYNINNGLSPDDIFSCTVIGCKHLRQLHVFGCPAFVLDARHQDRKKTPKWRPHNCVCQFLGFSKERASAINLIGHFQTSHVSSQFHVVYHKKFETITADMMIDFKETWIDLFKESCDLYLDWSRA